MAIPGSAGRRQAKRERGVYETGAAGRRACTLCGYEEASKDAVEKDAVVSVLASARCAHGRSAVVKPSIGAAGRPSGRAVRRVLTPDSSSPDLYYPLRTESLARRPCSCSGSLDSLVLAHLCPIRPENSGFGVAALAAGTGATRTRCPRPGQQGSWSPQTGRQGRWCSRRGQADGTRHGRVSQCSGTLVRRPRPQCQGAGTGGACSVLQLLDRRCAAASRWNPTVQQAGATCTRFLGNGGTFKPLQRD